VLKLQTRCSLYSPRNNYLYQSPKLQPITAFGKIYGIHGIHAFRGFRDFVIVNSRFRQDGLKSGRNRYKIRITL